MEAKMRLRTINSKHLNNLNIHLYAIIYHIVETNNKLLSHKQKKQDENEKPSTYETI